MKAVLPTKENAPDKYKDTGYIEAKNQAQAPRVTQCFQGLSCALARGPNKRRESLREWPMKDECVAMMSHD